MMRRLFASFAAVMLLAGTSVGAVAAPSVPGPPGKTFYLPPSPLPAGAHGDVIWSRRLTTAAALPHAAENLLVLYHTTAVDGKDVAVSGTISIPKGTPPAGGWPVISWAHGTTGDAAACTPSLDVQGGPEHWYLGPVAAMLDDYVSHGYAIVQTDYEGQGTPGIHPYLVGAAEGRDVVDMVRAARALRPQLGTRFLIMGHSQGGQSALFAASIAKTWAPELTLLGTVALAPASQLGPWLRGLTQKTEPDLGFGFAALLIRGYASVDPAVRADQLLTDATAPYEAELTSRCFVGLLAPDSWAGLVPATTFRPGADFAPLFHQADANEPGSLTLTVPVLLLQGTADKTVAPLASDALNAQLCAKHTTLTYRPIAGATHNGLLDASPIAVRPWVDARFAGNAATSNCGEALKAAT